MSMKTSTLSRTASLTRRDAEIDLNILTLSESSLQSTRAAIARWTKGTVKPVRQAGKKYVSPQQRWFTQAQRDLAAWIGDGGFSQACNPAAAAPAAATAMIAPPRYQLPGFLQIDTTHKSANACLE